MKAVTWLAATTMSLAAITSTAFANTLEGWSTDVEAALALAKKDKKSVLVEFTGSDWCPPCIMMRKNVFSKKEFVEKASKNYVLVEIDLPRADKALAARNQIVAEKYKIDGFPTVLLMDSEGKEFSRFYASEFPEMEKFLAHIDKKLENKGVN
jgi:thiol:disulfide interchange protein